MDKAKIGVIGLGWIAQVVHLPVLAKLKEAELVAVCDRDKGKARSVAEKFGVKRTYYDLEQMLEHEEDMNAVVVATSTDVHKENTIACLKAGKEVLVEKPIARTHAEAVEMAEAAKSLKRKLMVGMNHRFRPDAIILKSLVEAKELGKIYYARAGWLRKRGSDAKWFTQKAKSGGGVLVDLGIVILDMALWMMGYPDVKRVSAANYSHKSKQVEDTSVISLTLKNGSRIHIEARWSMALDEDVYFCHVFGTDGSASVNPLRIHKELHGTVVDLAPARMG
ncbi:MAG: Gfo/Idh/MocA family oxidoreductase, partial [Bacteroidetes bacterium]|nr:Gfo/Idh/MocA family oxidoreductase [Bacteroidota bacterium]